MNGSAEAKNYIESIERWKLTFDLLKTQLCLKMPFCKNKTEGCYRDLILGEKKT